MKAMTKKNAAKNAADSRWIIVAGSGRAILSSYRSEF
jgi:hypothetical protein